MNQEFFKYRKKSIQNKTEAKPLLLWWWNPGERIRYGNDWWKLRQAKNFNRDWLEHSVLERQFCLTKPKEYEAKFNAHVKFIGEVMFGTGGYSRLYQSWHTDYAYPYVEVICKAKFSSPMWPERLIPHRKYCPFTS
jgi:hypothetical protein